MKILINTSSFPNTINPVSGNFILDQINNLSKIYNDVHFIICTPGPTIESVKKYSKVYNFRYFFKKYENIGIKSFSDLIKESKLNFIVIFFFSVIQLLKMILIIKKEKPDLVYSHWFTPQGLIAYLVSKLFGIPYKITIHSTDLKIFSHYFGQPGLSISRRVLKSSSGITVTSSTIFDTVKNVLNEDEIKKLNIVNFPMGIDSNSLDVINQDLNIINKLNKEKKYILYVGRLVEKKGVELLIKSFHDLSKKHDFDLIIAGYGNLEEKLKKEVKLLGIDSRVIFTGRVNKTEKKALFNKSEILVVPSSKASSDLVSEGMPVTILEGLYFGKIVVASNLTNCEDVISDGVNGFVFKSNNSASITKVIDKVIQLESKEKSKISTNALKSSKLYDSKGSSKIYYDFLIRWLTKYFDTQNY